MYETVKELIMSEMEIEGVLAGLVDPNHKEGGKSDGWITTQSHGWATENATIHVSSYFMEGYPLMQRPRVMLIHGCFYKLQRITMGNGSRKNIKDIQIGEEILSQNRALRKVEPKKVSWVGKNGKAQEWLKIRTRYGPLLFCTIDHPMYLSNGQRVRADGLRKGRYLDGIKPILTPLQTEIIIGALLGDAHMHNLGCVFSHKNQDYNDLIANYFIGFNQHRRMLTSGFGSQIECLNISLGAKNHFIAELNPFHKIREIAYPHGKKHIYADWIKGITWRSLAVWYLDDGSIHRNKRFKKNGERVKDAALVAFATCSFTEDEVRRLSECLLHSFNLETNIRKTDNKYWRLFIDKKESANKFFKGVLAAFPIPKSLLYKIPEEYRHLARTELSPSPEGSGFAGDSLHFEPFANEVLEISPWKPRKKSKHIARWAITVEDNHNYYAGINLVGNTPEACYEGEKDSGSFSSVIGGLQTLDASIVMNKRQHGFWKPYDHRDTLHYVDKGIDLLRYTPKGMRCEADGKPAVGIGEVERRGGVKLPLTPYWALNMYYDKNPEMRLHHWGISEEKTILDIIVHKSLFDRWLGRYHFLGLQMYPENWYRAMDMLISPSMYGDPSRVHFEAMACGCPVIDWDSSARFGDSYATIHAKAFDPRDMAECVEKLWDRIRVDKVKVRTEARKTAEEHYDVKRMAKQVVEILRKVQNEVDAK